MIKFQIKFVLKIAVQLGHCCICRQDLNSCLHLKINLH